MSIEPDQVGSNGIFSTTKWTQIIEKARDSDPAVVEQALEDFCREYSAAIVAFFVRSGCTLANAQDHTQKFLTWRSSPFSVVDLIDVASLADKLLQPRRALDVYLAAQLSPATRAELTKYQGQGQVVDAVPLKKVLVKDLNRLVRGASIHDPDRFVDITLADQTRALLSQDPRDEDLERLNGLLIEDAYPLELSRKPLSDRTLTLVHQARRTRGRFRSFLGKALVNFHKDQIRAERAGKRGGDNVVSIEELANSGAELVAPSPESLLRQFDLGWARTLLDHASQSLLHANQNMALLTGRKTQAEVAAELGYQEESVKQLHQKFKHRFGKAIRIEVERTLGGCSTFSVPHLLDLPSLASKLRDRPGRKIDEWLRCRLASGTRAVLAEYQGRETDRAPLQQALLKDLNEILPGPSIFDESRFADVVLRPATRILLARDPEKRDPERLNRMLIEDAYPLEVSRIGDGPDPAEVDEEIRYLMSLFAELG